jgi:hemolysin activation/secretion protein
MKLGARGHPHEPAGGPARCAGLIGMALSIWVLLPSGCAAADAPPDDAAKVLPSGVADFSGSFTLRRVRFVGNTVFSTAELEKIAAPYEGRELNGEDLEDLRIRLTQKYVQAGYINSGAVIPQQSPQGGTLLIDIVEGRLTDAQITGQFHYRPWYLKKLIQPNPASPLNINAMQERMQLLLQDGVLQQINAQLVPGEEPGTARLEAVAREGPRFKIFFAVDDDRPPSVGETGGTVGVSARNLLGIGDTSSAAVGLTSGYKDYSIQESLPLLVPGLGFFAKADKNHGSIIESPVAELGILSKEVSFEAGLTGQLIRSLHTNLAASVSYYFTDTKTYLLGIPFSFTPGVDDGHSKVGALRYTLDWTYRGVSQVASARAALDVGAPAFGATRHPDSDLPDSQFVTLNAQFQLVQQVFDRSGEIVLHSAFQAASKGLLPSEKFAVGGIDTVRGYATNTLVRDEGAVASAEYRHQLFRLRIPGISTDPNDGIVALAVFYDAGMANDRYAERTWISGAGGGLRWAPGSNSSLSFYKGVPLHRLGPQGSSLQDHGLYFRANYELAW